MNYYKERYRAEHHLARYDEDTIDRLNLARYDEDTIDRLNLAA
jgi:hypothetical protein